MENEYGIKSTGYSPEELYTIECIAAENGAFVVHIRGKLCETLDDFYREISSAMRFPYYFGRNWAAFDECISDLEWLKFSSILIVIDNQESVMKYDDFPYESRQQMIKHLNMAVEYWKSQSIPISVYLNKQ